jgi:hypothetical protein
MPLQQANGARGLLQEFNETPWADFRRGGFMRPIDLSAIYDRSDE